MDTPFHQWTPCEVHGHFFADGEQQCRDCPERRDDDEE